MKKVAVIICNYNKVEYLLKCIESVKRSEFKDLDIYVVDNASTDSSVQSIKKEFKKSVNLIINKENLGGSGGFNTGIKAVLNHGYKYILLLDNDVIIEARALKVLYEYMENNNEVGAVGSKIYSMDNPQNVQEFGSYIDFINFNMKLSQSGTVEFNNVDEVKECDYIPACSALFRVDAIKKVGTIDEKYFVYWDDIDLCYRLKLDGYKIVANSNSKVWHKGGGTVRKNTFGTYYFWRNRIHFFAKYCDTYQLGEFSVRLFNEIFEALYSCNYIGKYSSVKTIFLAVEDALNNNRGKAPDSRYFELENIHDRLYDEVYGKKKILVICKSSIKALRDVIIKLKDVDKNTDITIMAEDIEKMKVQFPKMKIIKNNEMEILDFELVFQTCEHILENRKDLKDEVIYIDKYFNIIASSRDREYVRNYDNTYNMLKNVMLPIINDKMFALRSNL